MIIKRETRIPQSNQGPDHKIPSSRHPPSLVPITPPKTPTPHNTNWTITNKELDNHQQRTAETEWTP